MQSDTTGSYFLDEDDKILTIKISAFTPKTLKALQKTLSLHENENLKGLIIDLRGNTGGLLKEAVLPADYTMMVANQIKLFANYDKMRILEFLSVNGESCVCNIAEALESDQTNLMS